MSRAEKSNLIPRGVWVSLKNEYRRHIANGDKPNATKAARQCNVSRGTATRALQRGWGPERPPIAQILAQDAAAATAAVVEEYESVIREQRLEDPTRPISLLDKEFTDQMPREKLEEIAEIEEAIEATRVENVLKAEAIRSQQETEKSLRLAGINAQACLATTVQLSQVFAKQSKVLIETINSGINPDTNMAIGFDDWVKIGTQVATMGKQNVAMLKDIEYMKEMQLGKAGETAGFHQDVSLASALQMITQANKGMESMKNEEEALLKLIKEHDERTKRST